MRFKVTKTRVVFDVYDVDAETPTEAAELVARGKIREAVCDLRGMENNPVGEIQVSGGNRVYTFDAEDL